MEEEEEEEEKRERGKGKEKEKREGGKEDCDGRSRGRKEGDG